MDEENNRENGLLSTATHMARTLREAVGNRIELFLLEAKEDRLKLFDALCWAVVAAGLALMTMILVTFTIVVIFWDTYRISALVVLSLLYAAGATVAIARLRARLQRWESFPATMEQLQKDRACFTKQS
jgi:uncharacterized membrane protein YqjE